MLKKVTGLLFVVLLALSISTVAFASEYLGYVDGVLVRICPAEKLQELLAERPMSSFSNNFDGDGFAVICGHELLIQIMIESILNGTPVYVATFYNNDPIDNTYGRSTFLGVSTRTQAFISGPGGNRVDWIVTNISDRVIHVLGSLQVFAPNAPIAPIQQQVHLNSPSFTSHGTQATWTRTLVGWYESTFALVVDSNRLYPLRRIFHPGMPLGLYY
jgi:hypothetical protein